jgi:short-subunit dehydrogenase
MASLLDGAGSASSFDGSSVVSGIYALINNAGYGHEGTFGRKFHGSSAPTVRGQCVQRSRNDEAVLPYMRQRRNGRVINVTSMGGLMKMPGLSYYHGSKFALEGISSSFGKEVTSFGIFVTAVEPGKFRTDWAGGPMVRAPRTISDYDAVFDPIRATRAARSAHQPGDPAKAGRALATLLSSPNPPAHLLLGPDAFEYVSQNLDAFEV